MANSQTALRLMIVLAWMTITPNGRLRLLDAGAFPFGLLSPSLLPLFHNSSWTSFIQPPISQYKVGRTDRWIIHLMNKTFIGTKLSASHHYVSWILSSEVLTESFPTLSYLFLFIPPEFLFST
jgi:hypothetical protein